MQDTMMRKRRKHGFTLVELMIVVVIIGVLAALAVPSYTSYIMQTRASEGSRFLAAIGARQEAYYAEFGRYADITANAYAADWTANPANLAPNATSLGADGLPWTAAAQAILNPLGMRPSGLTYFSYGCHAGGPANPPGAPVNLAPDQWWVAGAIADLDGDGTFLTLELTSQSQRVWSSQGNGWE